MDLGLLFGAAQQGQQQGMGQMAMNLLFNSGQQYQQPRYQGIPGNVSNIYRYQPGLSEQFMNFMFPGTQQMMAPPVFLQSDFQDIMARTRYENQLRARYSENPFAITAAQTALQGFGFSEDEASKVMDNKMLRGITSMVGTMMFGKSASQQRGDVSIDLNRFFAGRQFRSSSGMFRMGITPEVNQEITDRLFRETYRDEYGMFKKMPFFGMQEMSDIMKLGIDYGLDIPKSETGGINTDQLIEQTKSLAKVIEAGMGIYNTLDKEEVIKNIMEMTRGTVALGDTSGLNNMIFRVNALAKNANISMKIMQKIVSEGAQIFDEIGISGASGAQLTADLFGFNKSMTQGETSVVDPDTFRRAGGAQAMRELDLANFTGTLQSDLVQQASSLYGFAKSMGDQAGMDAAMQLVFDPRKDVDKDFFDQKERLKDMYAKRLMKESGIGEGMARTLAEDAFDTSKRTGLEDLINDQIESGGLPEMMRNLMQKKVREELRASGRVPEVDKLMRAAQEGGRDSASYKAIVESLTERLVNSTNAGRPQARALAESMVGTATMSNERLAQENQRIETEKAIALRDQAMQTDFRGSSVFEKFMNEIQATGMDTPISSLFSMVIPTGPSAFTDPNAPTDVDYIKQFFGNLKSDDPKFKTKMREQMIQGYLEFGGFSDPKFSALFETSKVATGMRFVDSQQVGEIAMMARMLGQGIDDKQATEFFGKFGIGSVEDLAEKMDGTKGNISDFIKVLNKDFGQKLSMKDITNQDVLNAYAAFVQRDDSAGSKQIRNLLLQGNKLARNMFDEEGKFEFDQMNMFEDVDKTAAQKLAERLLGKKDISKQDAAGFIRGYGTGEFVPSKPLSQTEDFLVRQTQKLFEKYPGLSVAPEDFVKGVMKIEAGQNLSKEEMAKYPVLDQIRRSSDIAIAAYKNAMRKQELEEKKMLNAQEEDFKTLSKSSVKDILGKQMSADDRLATLKKLGIKPFDVPDFSRDLAGLIGEGKLDEAFKMLKPKQVNFKDALSALTDYELDKGVLSKQLMDSAKEDPAKTQDSKKKDEMLDFFKMMIKNVKDFVPKKADKIDLKADNVKITTDGATTGYENQKKKISEDEGARPKASGAGADAVKRDSSSVDTGIKKATESEEVSMLLREIKNALQGGIKKSDLDSMVEKVVRDFNINRTQQYS